MFTHHTRSRVALPPILPGLLSPPATLAPDGRGLLGRQWQPGPAATLGRGGEAATHAPACRPLLRGASEPPPAAQPTCCLPVLCRRRLLSGPSSLPPASPHVCTHHPSILLQVRGQVSLMTQYCSDKFKGASEIPDPYCEPHCCTPPANAIDMQPLLRGWRDFMNDFADHLRQVTPRDLKQVMCIPIQPSAARWGPHSLLCPCIPPTRSRRHSRALSTGPGLPCCRNPPLTTVHTPNPPLAPLLLLPIPAPKRTPRRRPPGL